MVVVCCWGRMVCAGREEGRDGDGCAGGVGFAGRDATVGLCRARWSENGGGIAIAVCRRRRRDRCRRGGELSLLIQDREISHATLMNRSLPRVRRPCSGVVPTACPQIRPDPPARTVIGRAHQTPDPPQTTSRRRRRKPSRRRVGPRLPPEKPLT